MSEIAVRPLIPEVLCGATAHKCRCTLPAEHDPEVHECDPHACGGTWTGDDRDGGLFVPVRFPSIAKALAAALDRLS